MMKLPSMRQLNPLSYLPFNKTQQKYEALPTNGQTASPLKKGGLLRSLAGPSNARARCCRILLRAFAFLVALLVIVILLGGGHYKRQRDEAAEEVKRIEEHANTRYWEEFPRINGFYHGVRTLVPYEQYEPDPLMNDTWIGRQSHMDQLKERDDKIEKRLASPLPLPPVRHDPFPNFTSPEYLANYYPVDPCYLDESETTPAPDIFSYPGIPQHMAVPFFGSYENLGISEDVCWDRFGRLGAYGYGYNAREGGLGLGMRSEQQGVESIWQQQAKIDWRDMDWGKAQRRCYEKNRRRFELEGTESIVEKNQYEPVREARPPVIERPPRARMEARDEQKEQPEKRWEVPEFNGMHARSSKPTAGKPTSSGKKLVPRTAFILRAWTGFEYTNYEILALRAMINELSLKSGGEYDVHLLLHVKDDTIPIWSSKDVYQKVIEENVPEEFWGITTLWSIQQMRMYYPGPFGEPPANIAGQEIHGVYRSAHFPMQWFAQEHPEYDFFWNWEMDIRHSGHHYEFHQGIAEWARAQPRRGLWERNEKFYIPALHGDWNNFTRFVDQETTDNGETPVWGPVEFPGMGPLNPPEYNIPPRDYYDDNFEWGVGEDADLMTFNPIFDPAETNWVFRKDISGYDLELPIPPRRCAIITVARLSRRLLDTMHEETYIGKHSAFPEMWPPTVALHHGFKAVYIPHPVYFDRKWPLEYMDQVFNYPETKINSPFGWGEHNWMGATFYYNSGFSGALWRRWLGERENNEGGVQEEMEGTGRMCLRSVLHHPIKHEDLPEE